MAAQKSSSIKNTGSKKSSNLRKYVVYSTQYFTAIYVIINYIIQ